MTRRNFTIKTKALIRERSGGNCEVHLVPRCMYPALPESCKRKGSEVDHITPDWAGGDNTVENGAFLCGLCHKLKTVTDNKEAKKSNRIRGQADKRAEGSSKMGKRPWPKHGVSRLSRNHPGYVKKEFGR